MSSNTLAIPSSLEKNPALAYLAQLAPEGRRTINSRLKTVAGKFGYPDVFTAPWHLLDYTHVQLVMAWLKQRSLAPNSVNHYLAAIRGVARESFRLGLMSVEVYERIKLVPRARGSRLKKSRRLTCAEVERLLDHTRNIRDEAIILVALQGGLRRSELVGIDWPHWERQSGLLTVRGKGDKERVVRISGRAESALGALWNMGSGTSQGYATVCRHKHLDMQDLTTYAKQERAYAPQAVFTNEQGGRLSAQAVYWLTQEICERAGVEPFSPHSYRHTMITEMLEAGIDPFTVQKVAGHAQSETTMGYDQRPVEAVAAAGKMIER